MIKNLVAIFGIILLMVLANGCTQRDVVTLDDQSGRISDLERRMKLNEQLDSIQSQLIQSNTDAIASEAASRIAGDSNLQSLLNAEIAARESGDQAQADALAQEQSDRIAANNVLQSLVNAERNARRFGDFILAGLLAAERNARISRDSTLANQLASESAARVAGDASLTSLINAEKNARIAGDNNLANLLAAERIARIAGDFALAGLLALEVQARQNANASQAAALAAETTARINGDNALSTLLAQEKAARIAGDVSQANALAAAVAAQAFINGIVQVQIASINSKFPVINNKLASLQSQLNQINADLDSIENQVNQLNVDMATLQLAQAATETAINDLHSDIAGLQTQIDTYGVKVYKCDSPTSTERIFKINNTYYGVMNRVTLGTVQVITGSTSQTIAVPKVCVKDDDEDKFKFPGGNGNCPSHWSMIDGTGTTVSVPAYTTANVTVVTSVKIAMDPIDNGTYQTTDGGPACIFSISGGVSTNLVLAQ